MHSIERYGIVALLFLIVTVVAVLLWDGDKDKKAAAKDAAKPEVIATRPLAPLPDRPAVDAQQGTLKLEAEPAPGPLLRAEPYRERTEPVNAPAHQPEPLARDPLAYDAAAPVEEEPVSADPVPLDPAAFEAADARRERAREVEPVLPPTTHTYVVAAGDTLSEIAQRELGSARRWQEIAAANPGLDPSRLRLGTKLQIPGATRERAVARKDAPIAKEADAPKNAPKNAAAVDTRERTATAPTWKVGAGESLWKIAERTLGDGKRWKEIADLNKGIDPDRLVKGAVLKLPASARTTAPAATKAKAATPVVASTAGEARSRRGSKVQ